MWFLYYTICQIFKYYSRWRYTHDLIASLCSTHLSIGIIRVLNPWSFSLHRPIHSSGTPFDWQQVSSNFQIGFSEIISTFFGFNILRFQNIYDSQSSKQMMLKSLPFGPVEGVVYFFVVGVGCSPSENNLDREEYASMKT